MNDGRVAALILERIESTPEDARSIATDADGTLWRGDAGDALYVSLLQSRAFAPIALEYLAREARALGLVGREAGGLDAAEAIRAAWIAGTVDDKTNCDIQARALGGLSLAQLRAHGAIVAQQIAGTTRIAVRDVVVRSARIGASVTVVTASLGLLVEACLSAAAIPFDRVAGARLQVEGDVTTTDLDGAVPMFREKVAALRSGSRWPATVGMGDGHWDAEFLREVALAVLVHPRPGLASSMAGAPNAVTWEPA